MNKLIAACKALVIARDEWDKLLDQFPSPEMLNAMSDIEDALNALAPAPASVCIDCSGDNKAWVDARSSNNPVRTDFCSKCGHRREVVSFPSVLASASVAGEVVVKFNINDLARYSPSFDEVGQACMRGDEKGFWIHIPAEVLKCLSAPAVPAVARDAGEKVCKMAAKVILTGEIICAEDGEDCTGIEGACDDDK